MGSVAEGRRVGGWGGAELWGCAVGWEQRKGGLAARFSCEPMCVFCTICKHRTSPHRPTQTHPPNHPPKPKAQGIAPEMGLAVAMLPPSAAALRMGGPANQRSCSTTARSVEVCMEGASKDYFV